MEQKLHVLLIEDNPADERLVREMIAESRVMDIELSSKSTLEEGLKKLHNNDELDLVLLDLGLPGTSGIETLDKFRSRNTRGLPVLVLTGLKDEHATHDAVQRGAEDYLIKDSLTSFGLSRSIRYAMERTRLRDELIQAKKHEALGKLAGGVAHDFNNLMTGVIGYAQLAQMELPEDHQIQEYLQDIERAGERAAELTGQVMAFSRQQQLDYEVVDLNTTLENMGGLLKQLIRADVEMVTELAPALKPVLVDPASMEQVVINLVLNACEAMPAGGKLTIQTENVVMPARELDDSAAQAGPGEYVRISVRDTGVGMEEDTREQIFEPFFSTKEDKRGTGLGLSSAFGTIAQSDGFITVESKPGEGTSMQVYLPVTEAEAELEEAPDSESEELPEEGLMVWLVEDEEVVRNFASQVLRRAHCQVKSFQSGEALVRELDEGTESPDLFVSDIVLPGMRGDRLVNRVRERFPGLPSLLMTGYEENKLDISELEGSAEVLQKPFSSSKLLQTAARVLRESSSTSAR